MSKTLKRKRIDGPRVLSRKKKIGRVARSGPIVRGDALKWREVKLPDRLEDAEGFYGLEEIEDVEILKDENGQISFRPKDVADVLVAEGEVAGEEWTGFDDAGDDGGEDDTETGPARNMPVGQMSTQKVLEQASDALPSTESRQSQNSKKKNVIKAPPASKSKSAPPRQMQVDVEDEIDFEALDESEEQAQSDVSAWKELGLSPEVLSAMSSLGFSHPTPIQEAAIPPIRDGRDVIGKAVTGSGKTLAFGVPIIESWLESQESLSNRAVKTLTAFILAPTRELAHQLSKHLLALSKGLDSSPRIATVTGGLALVKQQRQLEHADIIIGTPGRLWEVINSSHGLIDRLKQIQFLVIDEADRLLSEGHFKEVEEILDVLDRKVVDETDDGDENIPDIATPRQRQTLVFSATFHKGLQQRLASKQRWQQKESDLLSSSQSVEYLLRKLRFQPGTRPTFVDANPTSSMAEKLSESILECGAMQKDLYLYSLLLLQQHQHVRSLRDTSFSGDKGRIARTLIFTNSISTVKRLVPFLTSLCIPNTTTLPLHSSMPQKSRLRSLERFAQPTNSADTTTILIATDVAARGLDIKGVDTVVHYHVPRTADMYVHRSGRTARASSSGRSILICSPDEIAGVTRLISKIHLDRHDRGGQRQRRSSKHHNIEPISLPASLPTQLSSRVSLAQKISTTTLSTSQTKTEESWLRNAAQDLGVDYSSDEFETNARRNRRGRGGGREQRKKDAVQTSADGTVGVWKAELKDDLRTRRVDFGDGAGAEGGGRRVAMYLAGGAVDVERLLREGI